MVRETKFKLSVFGLGKLGVPLVACFISKGYEVIGIDLDLNKVKNLKMLKSPVYEKGVQELLDLHGNKLMVTLDGVEGVKNSDITFVVVATPTKSDGTFSNDYILEACKKIGLGLLQKKSYHLISITSTVMPGSMTNTIQKCLEESSGKIAGVDFGLCYNPEFIALGSVIHDFLNPDFVLIGESDPKAGELLARFYSTICNNNPPVARMNLINAELTKIALNSFITTKISFANMLARICEKLPGADVDVVTSVLGLDKRIGSKYLKGAISYGGPCFPRDNIALTTLAKKISLRADIAEVTNQFNRGQIKWLADLVQKYLPKNKNVGILGLAYKVDTNVIEEAPGLLLAQELVSCGIPVIIYDPIASENVQYVLKDQVIYATSALDCIKSSHGVVITTPYEEFSKIPSTNWESSDFQRVVIDCWRILRHLEVSKMVNYIPLGKGISIL